MAFCRNCGKFVDDNAYICPNCGVKQAQNNAYKAPAVDNGGFSWGLLGFILPMVGLILYLVWKDNKPKTARSVAIGALIFVCVSLFFYTLTMAFALFFGVSIFS